MNGRLKKGMSRILACLLGVCLVLPGFAHAQKSDAGTIIEQCINEPIEESLNIVKNGMSIYVIAIPNNATKLEQSAADELKQYIKKSTGVNMLIVKERFAWGKAIMIGATDFAQNNNVIAQGEESWIIKGFKNKLVLTGGETRGVLYSVYHFLEDIVGVRWWNPWEEYVPQLNNIIIKQDIAKSGTPTFAYREIYDGLYDGDSGYATSSPSLFYARNRINGHFSRTPAEYGGTYSYGPPYHVHTFSRYFPAENFFSVHPEWYSYSKQQGKRIPDGQLCLTNQVLLEEFINKVKESIRTSYAEADAKGAPRPVMYSVTQNDSLGSCQCDSCTQVVEQKGDSGLCLAFVNKIAEAIEEEYPEAKIDTLAYWFYVDPPKDGTKPRHNVDIRLAEDSKDILHSMSHSNNSIAVDRLKKWSALCDNDNLFIWDYAVNYYINPPIPTVFKYGEDFKLFKDNNVKGLFIEQEDPITKDMWNMNFWVQAKLMEDVNRDIGELIREFTDGYYGSAGEYIRQYLQLARVDAESSNMHVMYGTDISMINYISLDLAMEGTKLFELALKAVENDPVMVKRVNHARSCLDKAIVLKYRQFVYEAKQRNIYDSEFNLDRSQSAQRVVASLGEQLALMCQHVNEEDHKYYCIAAKRELKLFEAISGGGVKYPLPDELTGIPEDRITDFKPDMFRLWPTVGLSIVNDESSLVKKAARVVLAELEDAYKNYYSVTDELPLPIGIYYPPTGTYGSSIKIKPADIIPDTYKLFKIENTKLASGFLYIFRSWGVQQDLNLAVSPNPNQLYDIYVSMKFEGAAYGGDASKPDAMYVDRVIVVEKEQGYPLPDELKDIPAEKINDFTPETFRLRADADSHGLKLVDDAGSLVKKAAKVTLNDVEETNKKYYSVTDELPQYIGVYNRTTGTEVSFIEIRPADIIPDAYKLFKISDIKLDGSEFLYIFRSWGVQQDLNLAVPPDPNKLYDIYVSMKFEGAAYGGDASKPDAMYVDRVIVVEKDQGYPLPDELKDIPAEKINDFTPVTFRLRADADSHGLKLVDDAGSLVKKAAKVTLNDVEETNKKYYSVTDELPQYIGVYNRTTGTEVSFIEIRPADIIPDTYKLFKISDIKLDGSEFLYIFRSWGVQQDLNLTVPPDPNQLYDIYVSMKFEGAAYGGDASKPDAMYVDRVIVVNK